MAMNEKSTFDGLKAPQAQLTWVKAAPVSAFAENGSGCVLHEGEQIAVFNFTDTGRWFACQNLCPHKQQMGLWRGLLGDQGGEPKVACPFHKRTFSLETGRNLQGEDLCVKTYPVKVENGMVYVGIETSEGQ